jgi:hypothetical protein
VGWGGGWGGGGHHKLLHWKSITSVPVWLYLTVLSPAGIAHPQACKQPFREPVLAPSRLEPRCCSPSAPPCFHRIFLQPAPEHHQAQLCTDLLLVPLVFHVQWDAADSLGVVLWGCLALSLMATLAAMLACHTRCFPKIPVSRHTTHNCCSCANDARRAHE